ncbi:DUF2690 domain-containing protein [Streptomyces sp. NPDC000410]|uniref:DUF2690 domain-containing protein n=1 Tax=Streptomyces sp. NPDC000410 TaxID=3154254 RepID=UPI00331C2CA0
MLRGWWLDDRQQRKQDALANQLTKMDVQISQGMLSRYLAGKQIAREDVVRGLHKLLGREPDELPGALELLRKAQEERKRTSQERLRTPSAPMAEPAPAAQPPSATHPTPGSAAHPAPGAHPTPPSGPAAGAQLSVPPTQPPAPEAGPPERPGRQRKVPVLLAVAAVAVALLLTAGFVLNDFLGDDTSSSGKPSAGASATTGSPGDPAASQPSSSAAKELVSCKGADCLGWEPERTVCARDARTAAIDTDPAVEVVELRYSDLCKAAWAKMSNTTQGNIIRIVGTPHRGEYTQRGGNDAHTPMIPAARPEDVKACAIVEPRTVCATRPVPNRQ